MVRLAAKQEISFTACRSKLAESLEKLLKAELIRSGWFLEKTHDLDRLLGHLKSRGSDLVLVAEPLCDALADVYFTDRYPGFDLDDPNWPELRGQINKITELFASIKARVGNRQS